MLSQTDKQLLDSGFAAVFGGAPQRYFSAPGRVELAGNHTDHQQGRVLAAAVNLDTQAALRLNGTNTVRILSEGYPVFSVDLTDLKPSEAEFGTPTALVRGVAARFAQLGFTPVGFDAYMRSTVLPGSGLSSSAAFEVLIGTIFNHLLCGGSIPAPQIAIIGQYAENVFFGKACGLMDQMASSVGGVVAIDFACKEDPRITAISLDLDAFGHALCIIDTRASHADLTEEYTAIPLEMKAVAAQFGKPVLSQVDESEFYARLSQLRQACGDRAVLRAAHFFRETERVSQQVATLQRGDFESFLQLVRSSGQSSFMYLQNVTAPGAVREQAVAMALQLCRHYLQERGAYRVHGGGFAGTVQAFVPFDLLDTFRSGMEAVFGAGSCYVLSVRPEGGIEMEVAQ